MAQEAVASFLIGGVHYREVLKLRVHRDTNTVTGEGVVTLSWPGASAAAVVREGEMLMPAFMDGGGGQIYLDGQLAMTFIFDTRTSHGSPTSYELELHFRGRSSTAVDGAAEHNTGQENKKTPAQIAQKLFGSLGIGVLDKSGGGAQALERFIISQGETAERAVRRATREFGLNIMENEAGQVVLFGKGYSEGGGNKLVLGDRKITHWSVKRDWGPRFTQGHVLGNAIPTDEIYGKAAELMGGTALTAGQAFSKIRTYLADSDHRQGSIQDRAGYEGTRSSAQGLNVTLRVSTWTDESGELWKLLRRYPVSIPVDGVNESLLLSSVTFDLTPTERYATLVLTSENSFGTGRAPLGDVLQTGPNSMTEIFQLHPGMLRPEDVEEKKEKEHKPGFEVPLP